MTERWYVVHVYSGFENKVAASIREQARQKGMEEDIVDVQVPTEEVVRMRRGAKVSSERKFFPGYVLVKMEMGDESWHLVKNTPKVTGFLGGGGKPSPISNAEADRIMHQVKEGVERPKPMITFEVGEQVRVSAPLLHCFHCAGHRAVGCHHNHGKFAADLAQCREQRQPVHLGHLQVSDHQIDRAMPQMVQQGAARIE